MILSQQQTPPPRDVEERFIGLIFRDEYSR